MYETIFRCMPHLVHRTVILMVYLFSSMTSWPDLDSKHAKQIGVVGFYEWMFTQAEQFSHDFLGTGWQGYLINIYLWMLMLVHEYLLQQE